MIACEASTTGLDPSDGAVLDASALADASVAHDASVISDAGLALDASVLPCSASGAGCALTFRFVYRSDVATDLVYVQTAGLSGLQEWVTVVDDSGQVLPTMANCALCPCDQCGNCPVCGAALPTVETIASGGAIEWTWDTTLHPQLRCPSAPGSTLTCQSEAPLPVGHYTARFCFGRRTTHEQGGTYATDLTCQDIPFDWPDATEPVGVVLDDVCECG
jgi:hypothetical protein